ncbi:hypothetical protein JX266_003118 [Neoarthrinium moseri]|nr:hypothetical protein JX266_003118 [Neoarthrinium moseri]
MAKWRELGEVPDSDDESLLDSDESQPQLPPPLPRNDASALVEEPSTKDPTIWDIPISSQDHEEPALPVARTNIEIHIRARPISQEPESSPLSSIADPTEEDATTPCPSQHNESIGVDQGEAHISRNTTPEVLQSRPALTAEPSANQINIVEEDQDVAREESLRLNRSLRPRKPIQEHPYLLENAQYSHMFKSHGVRPVRLPAYEERRRALEEDSQEQDYEEDSQLTNGYGQEEELVGSQESRRRRSLDNGRDELALSSPSRPSPSPPRPTTSHELLGSSQNDDDLPSLNDIFRQRAKGRPRTYAKRRGSPKQSSSGKRIRQNRPIIVDEPSSPPFTAVNIFDIPPSPPQTSPAFISHTPATNVAFTRPGVVSLTPKPSSISTSRNQTPVPAKQAIATVDLTDILDQDSSGPENDLKGDMSDPEPNHPERSATSSPEPDLVFRRRIKGVLPASWIRLDQQVSRDKVPKPLTRRSPELSPEKVHRKGVAQRRQISPRSNNSKPFFFDDDSDDDFTTLRNDDIEDALETTGFPIFEDDAGSVIEEDHIDQMLPGKKRAEPSVDGLPRPTKRRKTQTTFKGHPVERKRQQKLTGMVNRSKSTTHTGSSSSKLARHTSSIPQRGAASQRASPPRLSILDVLEPNAPSFVRIAARTASRRRNKGRSSPSGKHISLGTRQDNIDALSVLRNWRGGKIQSRSLTTSSEWPRSTNSRPLQPIADNKAVRSSNLDKGVGSCGSVPVNRFSKSRKLVKQMSIDKFVDTRPIYPASVTASLPDEVGIAMPQPIRRILGRSKTHGTTSRPAQLETVGDEQVHRQAFHSRKRVLDALYRKSRKAVPSAPDTRLAEVFRGQLSEPGLPLAAEEPSTNSQETCLSPHPETRRRFRKLLRPRHVDIAAPQYAHANDPLPVEHVPISEAVTITEASASKLQGLGPYGTHYTQHFEVFPLDSGVFFRKDTLIGSGRLAKSLDEDCLGGLSQSRGSCTFQLDDRALCWSQWDAQTSSEFGVLYDWVADKLQPELSIVQIDSGSAAALTATQAADFSLRYLQEVVSFPDHETARHFVSRILETMAGFLDRLGALVTQQNTDVRQAAEVSTRCMLTVLQTLRVCEKLGFTESLQLEELLKRTAGQTARILLRADLLNILDFCSQLQSSYVRDRGIGEEQYLIAGWVVMMRVLQESRIPRAGFWDVVSPILLEAVPGSVVDAQVMERLWHTMFALLPLAEFDNAGVVTSGLRHSIPLEGWNLPQKLLGRVFDTYNANQRQSPSFNDYCRALVSRCHYLVEQWGWRKCSGIIGTIFDFFASQNLSHLRNEEVYKSPQFLEDLAGTPSLVVQSEDRCFHIFLKLLALSIQRLRKHGLIKDLKNLIARVLPNHDRQYLKESDVHEHELASLRNHHDLLCTLFWCSPQPLRPSVQLLEKLVIPGSSHKEACLINLRAWNQLGRFVVFLGEDRAAWKPFADWQNNVFKQVLDQYASVESDIQQQFLRMSKESSNGVSPELMKRVVNMNKQAATDVLHFSLKANLDVMRHASSLGAASFVLNTYQLHEVFFRFSFSPPSFDWSTQRVAVEILGHYLDRIEKFFYEHETNSDLPNSWHGEDAIMVLDRHVSVPFCSMARNLLGEASESSSASITDGKETGLEKTTHASGRLAALFLRHKVTRLSSFFSPGKYGLFSGPQAKLSLHSRKYMSLFASVLVERGVADFTDINSTPLEFYLCSITKPSQSLAYEYRLVRALKLQGNPYLKEIAVHRDNPDYELNRDLFDRTLSSMRRAIRHEQNLQREVSQALRAVMDQMKQDLKLLVSEPAAHKAFIQFVRMIVPLIKKHDLCPIDPFFCQISKEYSPSAQDPRLQTAAILSYGLKLEDEDRGAVPRLFYFLYPNFKLALANGKLSDERDILREGMENKHIFSFVLSRMLPAIIRAVMKAPEAWLILDVYVEAVERLLDGELDGPPGKPLRGVIHRSIGHESMEDLLALLKFVGAAVQHYQRSEANIRPEHLQSLTLSIKILNQFGPSLVAYLCTARNSKSHIGMAINKELDAFTDFTREAGEYLSEVLSSSEGGEGATQTDLGRLLEGIQFYYADPSTNRNENANSFAQHMVEDIQKNWVSTGGRISVRGPAHTPGVSTQSGQGTAIPPWNWVQLVAQLNEQIQEWNRSFDTSPAMVWNRRQAAMDETWLF